MLFFILLVKNVLYQLPHPPLIVRMTPPLTVMNVVVDISHLVMDGKDRNQLMENDRHHLHIHLTHILLQQEGIEVNRLRQDSLIVNVGLKPLVKFTIHIRNAGHHPTIHKNLC